MSEDLRAMGPIDWLLIEYSGELTGKTIPPILDLVERGLVRILDVVIIDKANDGSFAAIKLDDLDGPLAQELSDFFGLESDILGEEDIIAAGEQLLPGTLGVMLLFENLWAAPFAIALREAGGVVVDSGRIPVQQLIGALDEIAKLEAQAG